jgi:hypothetical protein
MEPINNSTQVTRVVHLQDEPYDAYIGRAGKGQDGYFGNPHRIGYCEICDTTHNRKEAIAAFRKDFVWAISNDALYKSKVQALRGKVLGCFCKPEACHGDVFIDYLHPTYRTYKGHVTKLEPHQVFVFGSNIMGFHGAGAAGYASFGVPGNRWREFEYDKKPDGWKGKWNVKGRGSGMQEGTEGKSYALPTVRQAGWKRSLSLGEIRVQIAALYDYAFQHPEYDFLVAQENKMGLNGYTPEEMASIYREGRPSNVLFEEEFAKLL